MNAGVLVSVCLMCIALFLSVADCTSNSPESLNQLIRDRSLQLQSFVARSRQRPRDCPKNIWYLSSRYHYGRTGNRWMQYANLLWLAETLNYTVFISRKETSLQIFNITSLKSAFCIQTDVKHLPVKLVSSMSIKPINVHSYSHMLDKFRGVNNTQLLPDENNMDARMRHTEVLLTFYARLFGSIQQPFLVDFLSFMVQSLDSSFQYVAIQKRHFERSCVKLMHDHFNYSDFSEKDFNKSHADWLVLLQDDPGGSRGPLNFHPLCNMTAAVIHGAQAAHGLENLSAYVLLTDGQESITSDLLSLPLTNTSNNYMPKDSIHQVTLDLLLGLHAGLLLRNPYSTLTLPLEVLRVILHLPTSSMDKSSNISLSLLGKWFTMSDVNDAVRKHELVSRKMSQNRPL